VAHPGSHYKSRVAIGSLAVYQQNSRFCAIDIADQNQRRLGLGGAKSRLKVHALAVVDTSNDRKVIE
jgi:hypothetical protein